MDDLEYPAEYLEGIRLFNEREFFACHDVLEELWTDTLGPERTFYQGLIHAAVSLFHFEEGNLGGARKMYDSTNRYLSPFAPAFMGLDLAGFLRDYQICFQAAVGCGFHMADGGRVGPGQHAPIFAGKPTPNMMSENFDLAAELAEYSGTAALFPLPGAVFFPRMLFPLHIFERRYRRDDGGRCWKRTG